MNILKLVMSVGSLGRDIMKKHKDEINRKRREERACNGNIKCECGLIVKPENGMTISLGLGTGQA